MEMKIMNLYTANFDTIDGLKNFLQTQNIDKHNQIMCLLNHFSLNDIYLTASDGKFYRYTNEYMEEAPSDITYEDILARLLDCYYKQNIHTDPENDYHIGVYIRSAAAPIETIYNIYGLRKNCEEVYFYTNINMIENLINRYSAGE